MAGRRWERHYDWKAGVWRLLDLLDGYGLMAGMSTSGRAAKDLSNMIPAIRQWLSLEREHDNIWFARKCDIAQWALDRETA